MYVMVAILCFLVSYYFIKLVDKNRYFSFTLKIDNHNVLVYKK